MAKPKAQTIKRVAIILASLLSSGWITRPPEDAYTEPPSSGQGRIPGGSQPAAKGPLEETPGATPAETDDGVVVTTCESGY